MQDRAIVTMEFEYETVPKLLSSTSFNYSFFEDTAKPFKFLLCLIFSDTTSHYFHFPRVQAFSFHSTFPFYDLFTQTVLSFCH